jgi:hypothetical protein
MGIESVDIDIIMRQTGVKDKIKVRQAYFKNKKNISTTILELMSIEFDKPDDKPKTEIEKLRHILDEKEKIYQNKNKKT